MVADEVRKLAERTQKSLMEIEISVNTIVQSINDVGDKMHHNANNIETLTTIANDVASKIAITSTAMQSSTDVADKSHKDSLEMAENIKEIIASMENIETLSTANGTSVVAIEKDVEQLVVTASSLQKSIEEFKS